MPKNINKILYGVVFFVVIFFSWTIYKDNRPVVDADQKAKDNSKVSEVQKNTKPAEKVQIYEFHSTNRCYSCITMGQYIKATVEEFFQAEIKSGKLEFKEINVDLPENKAVATKYRAAGTALFINSIIDGEDNIEEEVQAWRLLGNQKTFSDYLTKKLRGIIGETVSIKNQTEMEKMNVTFYFSDNCSSCATIEKYLTENSVKNKVAFEEKNIDHKEADAEQMAEDAMQCDIDPESFGVPLLWAEGKCYTNEKEIIDFFKQRLS